MEGIISFVLVGVYNMEREKIKIEAIVSSGGQVFYVINRPLQMSYTKIDHETIIGEDEGALRFYKRDNMTLPFGETAFGGHKFTLQLTDGSVEECHGQWWDDMSKSARELFKDTRLCHFVHGTKEELKKCYVFCGCVCEMVWLEKLLSEYKGDVFEYWEYEKILKDGIK